MCNEGSSVSTTANFTPYAEEYTGGRWMGEMDKLREQCPVFHSDALEEEGFYVLTKYEDLMYAHQHPEIFSSCPVTIPRANFPRPWGPIEADPPVHKQLRSILNPYFSAREIGKHEEEYRQRALSHIVPLVPKGEGDLYKEICAPLPLEIIMDAFAIEGAERTRLVELFYLYGHKPTDTESPEQVARIIADAATELYAYFEELVRRRRKDPGDGDMITQLIQAEEDIKGEPLTDYEIVDYAMIVVPAGFETTASSLSYSLNFLGHHPEVREELRGDLSLVPDFIEELLRYETPVKALGRTVMVDHEMRGQQLRRGDRVMMLWPAGNRDPDQFKDPGGFDLHRKPNRHLSFGAGSHRCSGLHMARLSMQVALEEWLKRVPDWEILDDEVTETPGPTWALTVLPARW